MPDTYVTVTECSAVWQFIVTTGSAMACLLVVGVMEEMFHFQLNE